MSLGKYSFSTSKGGASSKKKKFYLEKGSNIYRVLPPYGTLSSRGKIAQYWAVTWVSGTKGKRPVVSILEKSRDGAIIQRDPLLDKIEALRLQAAELEKNGSLSEEAIASMKKNLNAMSLDKAYYVNAMNSGGEVGVLKLKSTAWKALQERLAELDSAGIDPISPGSENGLFFNFKRTETDGKTVYSVDIHSKTFKDPVTGRMVTEPVPAPLSEEEMLTRMKAGAEDLTTLFTAKTPEEVALIATLDPATIDRVFQVPSRVEEVAEDDGDGDNDSPEGAAESLAKAGEVNAAVKAASATTTAKATPTEDKKSGGPATTPAAAGGQAVSDEVRKLLFG